MEGIFCFRILFIQCHTGNQTTATTDILYKIFPLTVNFGFKTVDFGFINGSFGYKNKAFSYKIQAAFIKSYSMPLMFRML